MLAVALIGQGLALARGLVTKHAIKQVDRMLANQGIDIDALLHHWVPFVVGKRPGITVAMDWTEFEADGNQFVFSFSSSSRSLTSVVRMYQDGCA